MRIIHDYINCSANYWYLFYRLPWINSEEIPPEFGVITAITEKQSLSLEIIQRKEYDFALREKFRNYT